MNTIFFKGFILTCLFAGSSVLYSGQKTRSTSPQSPSSVRTSFQKKEDAVLRAQMPVSVNIFLPGTTEPIFSYNYQGILCKSLRQVVDLVIHPDVLKAATQPRVPKLSQSSSSTTVATQPTCSATAQDTSTTVMQSEKPTEPSEQQTHVLASQSSSTATTITTPLVTAQSTNKTLDFYSQEFISSFSDVQTEYLMSLKKRLTNNNSTIRKNVPQNTPLKQTYEAICNLLIKNYTTGLELLKQASEAKCNDAKVILAYCYRYGVGTQQNEQLAQDTLNSSASYQDDPEDADCSVEYLKKIITLGV